MAQTFVTILGLFLSIFLTLVEANDLARGWGDDINWMTLDDGLKASEESGKPVMLLIHKTWCGACKALKPKFAENEDIRKLSDKFVMVNVQDDEEPDEPAYKPDGGYIPRVLFLNSAGEVQEEVFNRGGNPQYKYYYPDPKHILATMNEAAYKIKPVEKKQEDQPEEKSGREAQEEL